MMIKITFHLRIVAFVLLNIVFLTLVATNSGLAQPTVVSDFKKVPTPPSPNVAALGKFGDIPVSASTGIPSISIPIYSYGDQQKDLSLDVSLNYHAGGHKVEDMASNVGFGWALNAGGVISRTMRGLPDEMPTGYLYTPSLPLLSTTGGIDVTVIDSGTHPPISQAVCSFNSADFITIKSIAENQYDSECDIFNLSVGGINEKFFFDKNRVPVFISPNNLKLQHPWGTGGYASGGYGFIVTDEKGVSYFFNVLESTQTDNAIEPSVPAPPMYTSSWYLSKIRSADRKDSIMFTYETTTSISYEAGLTLSYKTTLTPVPTSVATYSYNNNYIYNAQRISTITLPDKTTVEFNYSLNRLDYVGDKALTSIQISSGQQTKLFRLSYDYFTSDNCYIGGNPCPYPPGSPNNWQKRLKLLSVREESGASVLPPYQFEYNTTPLPFRSSKEQDWWGFYNGGAVGGLMDNATSVSVLGLDRIPSLTHCKAWNLEKIIYPTGGDTRFTYELNEGITTVFNGSTYVQVVKPIGGLRVQKKEDYDPITGSTYTTNYTYTKPDSSTSGVLLTIPSYTAYNSGMSMRNEMGFFLGKDNYFHESLNPTQTLSYFNGSPVVYTRVKEEQYVSGSSNGYKIYEYSTGSAGQMHDFIYPFVQRQDISWTRGLLLKASTFNAAGSILVSEKNEYQTNNSTPPTTDATTRNLVVGNYWCDNLGTLDQYIYGARYYYLTKGRSQLFKNTKTVFSNSGDSLRTVTEYSYDPSYYVPTVTKTTDSQGKTLEQKTYYPFNYNSTTYPLMGSLMTANRVSEAISVEEWITIDGVSGVKSILVSDYVTVNSSMLKKNKISLLESQVVIPGTSIGSFNSNNMYRHASIKEKARIEQFDARGRGVQIKSEGGEVQSTIWGDYNGYPMASVVNAEFADVAFTSFEMVEKGNWQYAGVPGTHSTAPTGLKVYVLSDGSITKNINSGKNYIVGFWSTGSVSVSSSTLHRTGKTIDGWTYKEYLISGASVVTISGTGFMDELRLSPQQAQMTSFTFFTPQQPSTQSDANGTIVRYEYDVFGRLEYIKDEEKNVLKKMDYHYKGQ